MAKCTFDDWLEEFQALNGNKVTDIAVMKP
jgi:hypothetical protein